MQTWNKPRKRNSRAFEKQEVWSPTVSIQATQHHKENPLRNRDYPKKRTSKFYLKNPYFQEYSPLSISATRGWSATVQYSNPRMQVCIRDCAEEQLTDRYKIFLKKQEKLSRLSNTEASMNQKVISHTDFKQRLVRGDRNNLQQSRYPHWSRQFYCTWLYTL